MGLKRPWMGHHYHATYSNYARGVSVLIHRSLNFEPLDVIIDPEGRYVVMHAIIDTLDVVLVGLYLPPPANLFLLQKLITLIAQFSTDNVILTGDFNVPPNPSMDKLTPDSATDSTLSRWARVFGLEDVWRWKHPTERMYTCHSSSYNSLSPIDLPYASIPILPKITGIEMLPRGISDHSPLICTLQTITPQADRLWRLSKFWIEHPTIHIEMAKEIKQFWRINATTSTAGTVWDTFKAYIRGCYLSSIARECRNDRFLLEEAEAKARDLESWFILTSNPTTAQDMNVAYREVMLLRVAKANKCQLAQTQRIFEQGDKTGRLLAWISREQSLVSTIARLRRSDGTLVSDPVKINACFAEYYSALYSSRVQYSQKELGHFLDGVAFPVLTTAAKERLDAPITLEEVQ